MSGSGGEPPVTIVGFSGPDGAGKSGTVAALSACLSEQGVPVATVYLYGCVVCRRLSGRTRERITRQALSRGGVAGGLWRTLRALHAAIDVAELAIRLEVAVAMLRREARHHSAHATHVHPEHRPRILLTDRSPLDGLAKYAALDKTLIERAYRTLATRYRLIFLLSAAPEVLAARDGEHGCEVLQAALRAFEVAARPLRSVTCLDTTNLGPEAVLEVVRARVLPLGWGGAETVQNAAPNHR